MKKLFSLALLGFVVAFAGCSKSPTATVEFKYTTQPKQPLSEDHMQIAVKNANVTGDTDKVDQNEWATMTADSIQRHLEQAAEEHNIPLKLVDREHMKLALEEKDLAASGITESNDDIEMSALKGANTLVTSKVTIKIDKQKGKGRTVDALSAFGSRWGGGGSVKTTEVDKESRNITVQCQFQPKDAATNDILVSYNGEPSQHYERGKTSPFFGGSKTESDMTPRDQVIGRMIDYQAKQFMAKFVPVTVETEVEVKGTSNEDCQAGIKSLVIGEWEMALKHFKQALAEDPNSDKTLFAAGVACEKMGKFPEALKYYKQARSYDTDDEDYAAAVDRVSNAM